MAARKTFRSKAKPSKAKPDFDLAIKVTVWGMQHQMPYGDLALCLKWCLDSSDPYARFAIVQSVSTLSPRRPTFERLQSRLDEAWKNVEDLVQE